MGKKLSSLRKQVRNIERQVDALKHDLAKLRKAAAPQSSAKHKKSGKKSKRLKEAKRGSTRQTAKQKGPRKAASTRRKKAAVASSHVVSVPTQSEMPASANESAQSSI